MPSSEEYEDILTTHLNDMYALAMQLTGSTHNAEDLVQDLFISLSMRRYRKREIERPRAWLATILYRIFIDQWRRQKRSPVVYGVEPNDSDSVETLAHEWRNNDPVNYVDRQRQQNQALAVLDELNEQHREIIILFDLHEYTMNEIAEIMGLPLGTVKSNLHRARKHISLILQRMESESGTQRLTRNPKSTSQPASSLNADTLQESV